MTSNVLYLQPISSATTLNLSGETDASSAEEQLARDSRIRYQGIQGRLYASPVLPQIPGFPAMPPKTLGSGAKPQVLNIVKSQTLKFHFTVNRHNHAFVDAAER